MYKFQISNFKFQQKGFTLVETLVSLVILTVALIPLLGLSTSSVRTSGVVRDNLVAAGLAQEGVEVIRAIRDTNWFNGRAFDSGLTAGDYRVDWDSQSLLSLSGNPALNILNGEYTYDGGVPTKFSRKISITKVNAGELRIISEVTWTSLTGVVRATNAESHLFDWE